MISKLYDVCPCQGLWCVPPAGKGGGGGGGGVGLIGPTQYSGDGVGLIGPIQYSCSRMTVNKV